MSGPKDVLAPGTEIFGYVIDKVLGRGGMGTVYLATQTSLGRKVALKVLHNQRIRNPAQVESFLREARQAGKLSHPHLVMIHAVHSDPEQGLHCYSMEYIDGENLTTLVGRLGPLKRNQALHITFQIAKALAHAHAHSLVHRDVKPDNILVSRNGLAKLADLGLVRDRLEGIIPGNTNARHLSIVGTPEYAAPEQSRNPEKAKPASDLYSLGACLYFMVTGAPPFTGDSVIDLIVRAATEDPLIPPTVDHGCATLIRTLMAKHPEERCEDGQDLVDVLETVANGQTITAVLERRRPQDTDDIQEPEGPAQPGAPVRRMRRRARRFR